MEYIHLVDKNRFGRPREEILERDNWKCLICGSKEDLTIDHIDGNGRNSKKPNNKLNNLRTLCRQCHGRIDYKRRRKFKDLPLPSQEKILNNLLKIKIKIAKVLKIEKNCIQCGKSFLLKDSQIKQGRGKHCSMKCYTITRRKTIWKGGI